MSWTAPDRTAGRRCRGARPVPVHLLRSSLIHCAGRSPASLPPHVRRRSQTLGSRLYTSRQPVLPARRHSAQQYWVARTRFCLPQPTQRRNRSLGFRAFRVDIITDVGVPTLPPHLTPTCRDVRASIFMLAQHALFCPMKTGNLCSFCKRNYSRQ
jgi:hypothetical protein